MAQRLPTPGSDDNTWGDVLNGFLGVAHAADGTLASGVVGATQIANAAITTTQISATAGIVKGQLATAVQTSLGLADTALQSVPGLAKLTLAPTATKTAAYTAAAQDLVIADASGGGFTVTLPTAPVDATLVEIKKIDSSANTVTVATGGSDTYTTGGTSTGLALLGQAVTWRYQSSTSKWIALSNDLPLVATDARYATQSQLNSYTVDPNSIGIPIVGTNGITVTETSSAITIGYGGTGSSGGGAISRIISQVTAAVTAAAAANTDYVYWWSSATAYTLTMPTAASNTDRYTLKNASTVAQTIATTSSQTIEGGTSITISAGNSVDLISNGANWMVI